MNSLTRMTQPTPQSENTETDFEKGDAVVFDRYGDGEELVSATFSHAMPGMSTDEKTVVSVDPDDRETDYEFVAARTLSRPETDDADAETTVECPTCEEQVPERFMSGGECVSCEHVRADARDAKRSAEREAAPDDAAPVDGRRP